MPDLDSAPRLRRMPIGAARPFLQAAPCFLNGQPLITMYYA